MLNWKNKKKNKKLITNLEMQEPDRYYKQVLALQNQKKINLGLLLIIVFLSALLGKAAFFYQTKVYIVEKDKNNYTYLGNVRNLSKTNYNPNDSDIIYFLNDIIKNMRFIPTDAIVVGKNRKKLNYFLNERSKNKLNNYDIQYNINDLIEKSYVVDIIPLSAIRLSNSTFQMRWIEKIYNLKGQQTEERLMVAAFKYNISSPKSETMILNNPIGLEIEDFSIQEEK